MKHSFPLLEIRSRSLGLVCRRQMYPKTVHYICQIGPVESRLIVGKDAPMGLLSIVSFLVVGLFTR